MKDQLTSITMVKWCVISRLLTILSKLFLAWLLKKNFEKDFDQLNPDAGTSDVPWRIFNIGNGNPIELMDYIYALETALNKTAEKNYLDMQMGDVQMTSADTSRLHDWINFKPHTSVEYGVAKFVEWYKNYYKVE